MFMTEQNSYFKAIIDCGLLSYDIEKTSWWLPTFRRNISHSHFMFPALKMESVRSPTGLQ
jgi:hypothetical protein